MAESEWNKAEYKRYYKWRIRNFQVTGVGDKREWYAKDDEKILVQRDKDNTVSSGKGSVEGDLVLSKIWEFDLV